jgi:hypothetical protein
MDDADTEVKAFNIYDKKVGTKKSDIIFASSMATYNDVYKKRLIHP